MASANVWTSLFRSQTSASDPLKSHPVRWSKVVPAATLNSRAEFWSSSSNKLMQKRLMGL